jgi:dienelactone hydrolase/predicted Ser/Thr protein kinase
VIGETISHYRVISEIGAGGMGVVYKAEDLRLGRFVALKFLPPQLMRDDDARRRLFAEARAASTLDHANVCTIYDVEELPDGRAFIAMAFLDGETLKTRLDRGPLSPGDAARLTLQVAHGLARAHQAGIAHRDIKPANIMIDGDGQARLLDFGIAKFAGGGDLTRTGTTVGTIAYMAPEHLRGGIGDARGDVWALGVVLYEMLAGKRPFTGADDYELLQAIIEKPVPPLPPSSLSGHDDLARIVSRALDRDPQRRYANAGEMAHALEQFLQPSATTAVGAVPVVRTARSRAAILAAILVFAAVSVAGLWAWRSGAAARTARNVTLPEALRLADLDRYGEAFVLAADAERAIPTDPVLVGLWPRISRRPNIITSPTGADVSFALIGTDNTWHPVGRTPLENVRVPRGVFRWRFGKPGFEMREVVRATTTTEAVFLPGLDQGLTLTTPGTIPAEMVLVPVPSAGLRLMITGFDFNIAVSTPDFLIDRAEVTNSEFKAFVDAGGYSKREFWTVPFVRDGQPIEWAAAMNLFRDRTGRPGPATWEGGAPPDGHDQYPVNGVSWYEAAAYAAFRGKRLPTIYHWSHAAGPELGDAVTRTSNYGRTGPRPAAAPRGLGPYGTVDMAGNVKEWVWNDNGHGARYVLGGAWNDPDYAFLYSDFRLPFDRSETNGFRCMKDAGQPAAAKLSAAIAPPARNYATEKPVADAIYRIYAEQYAYDRTPLDPRLEKTDDSSAQWRREIVSIAPAYGGERLPINLLLPRNVKPPFQTVLFFPGSGAIRTASSATLADLNAVDFVLMSGRAVAYPIYKYTYERSDPSWTSSWPTPTRAYTNWVQQIVTDARRTLDYLETRSDLAGKQVAYVGESWGARMAPITIAIDSRIRVGVLLMGGLASGAPAPEADPFNFLPRVKVPILMVNGDEDFIFPVKTLQQPFFEGLGTAPADKKHVLYPGGHEIVATKRSQLIQEVVAWLDKYLGRVQ